MFFNRFFVIKNYFVQIASKTTTELYVKSIDPPRVMINFKQTSYLFQYFNIKSTNIDTKIDTQTNVFLKKGFNVGSNCSSIRYHYLMITFGVKPVNRNCRYIKYIYFRSVVSQYLYIYVYLLLRVVLLEYSYVGYFFFCRHALASSFPQGLTP